MVEATILPADSTEVTWSEIKQLQWPCFYCHNWYDGKYIHHFIGPSTDHNKLFCCFCLNHKMMGALWWKRCLTREKTNRDLPLLVGSK